MCFTCFWATGPLLAASGETLETCWPPFGGSWPSWAGLGVSWTVLGGPVECPRAVASYPASRNPLQVKSKSRLSRLLLISTSIFMFTYTYTQINKYNYCVCIYIVFLVVTSRHLASGDRAATLSVRPARQTHRRAVAARGRLENAETIR